MADWLEHPRYVVARSSLVNRLKGSSGGSNYRFRRLDPILFLCGGANSPRREALRTYFKKFQPKNLVFFAETVWDHIASNTNLTAMQMEEQLAELADAVLIVVESPGTFTELGAFSLSPRLRKKILPIVDATFKDSKSFISTGPLAWIDRDSIYGPTVYTSLDAILIGVKEIEERLEKMPAPRPMKTADLAADLKLFLFFLCDLVSVIGPATLRIVEYFVGEIVGAVQHDLQSMLALLMAMELVVVYRTGGEAYYSPSSQRINDSPFHHKKGRDLPSERARHIGVLQTIPQASAVLTAIGAIV